MLKRLLVLLLLLSCLGAESYFEEVCTRSDFSNKRTVPKLWKSNIYYYIAPDCPESVRKTTILTMIEMEKLTGVSCQPVPKRKHSNFTIDYGDEIEKEQWLIDRGRYSQRAMTAMGLFIITHIGSHISHASVFITPTGTPLGEACITREEVIQSFGLHGDSMRYNTSMFYKDKVIEKRYTYNLSKEDIAIIKELYSGNY